MTEKARFRYSAQEGTLELEGSEEFVSQHFESLTDIVRMISRHTVVEQKREVAGVNEESEAKKGDEENTSREQDKQETILTYPNVFAEINGKLKIVCDVPGNTKSHKMANAALLYCYGSTLLGDEQVSSTEIRSVCEEHGFLDGANFSKIFADKTTFLSDGVKGGNKQIKLTHQGKKKAKELLLNELSKN